MKERINDLIGASLDQVVPYTWTTLDYNEVRKLQEKLAEMIVNECIELVTKIPVRVEPISGQNFKYIQLGTTIDTIKDHFGLEFGVGE